MKATRTLGNELAELPATLDWLEAALRAADVDKEQVGEWRLVAEEGLSNIIRHGYTDTARHSIAVALELDGGEVRLVLRDDGRAFNPLAVPAPDLDRPPEERPDGGLGVLLLKTLVDRAEYRRENGTNVLRLARRAK